ncbi:MAG: pyrroloquinoline quinone biosynthesis protein PqqC [Cyanobacteria bacterium P01_F01_bin.53]
MQQSLNQSLRFRDRVVFKRSETAIDIRHGQQGISIAIEAETQSEIYQLLRCLRLGGRSRSQLIQDCPGLQAQIPELLNVFEARGMLVSEYATTQLAETYLSGSQFYRQLTQSLTRFKQQFPPSPLSQRLADQSLSREQLIGYALESYQITHLCTRLLAPALAHPGSPTTQKHLQDFFVSELNHDQLLEKSLSSVGVAPTALTQMQPLPMTFAVCSSLSVFAQQDPLSFKAALMLFEEDDKAFYELFIQQCQALAMPTDFYQPILQHAHINDEGGHDQLTALLMNEIAYVSQAEQQRVKKNMTVLIESMILRTYEILDYYGNENNKIPRCFP